MIVIGGSTGSIDVLQRLCADLPPDLPASVLVVVHVGAGGQNQIARLIGGCCRLPVTTATEGEPVERGHVYVAAANHHLLLDGETIRLGNGPRENMSRPAVDPLFRSAAASFGPRVIGLVLSGQLNDGAAGLATVKGCGGITVVQNPSGAEAPGMPTAALEACEVDYRTNIADLGTLLATLSREPAGPAVAASADILLEINIALGHEIDSNRLRQIADPSTICCPACGGVLSELRNKHPLRFRCQVGHAYSAEILDQQQDVATQQALAVAMRVVEARAALVERMAQDARDKGRDRAALSFEDRAREYRQDVDTIRLALQRLGE